MFKQIWKDLIYDGVNEINRFEISNDGSLRNKYTQHIYKLHTNNEGYFQVCVSLGSRKNKKNIKIHIAVANTFIDNKQGQNMDVNHKDGNKLNNLLNNLEWCTHSHNIIHALKNGLIKTGESSKSSKLLRSEVDGIRSIYKYKDENFNAYRLAEKFNVSESTIRRIINNETWMYG